MSLEVWYLAIMLHFAYRVALFSLGYQCVLQHVLQHVLYVRGTVCVAMCVTSVPHFNNRMHSVYRVALQDGEDT